MFNFQWQESSLARPRMRILELVKDKYDLMPHGDTGDDSLTTIPFQVLRSLIFYSFSLLFI